MTWSKWQLGRNKQQTWVVGFGFRPMLQAIYLGPLWIWREREENE
jgi:hypothetical protein